MTLSLTAQIIPAESGPPRRALHSAQKQAKRDSILSAARLLFEQSDDELPSAAAIAESCGLAKGTVYLYFRSKEDIFLSLLSHELSQLLREVRRSIGDSDSPQEPLADRFAHACVAWIRSHPMLLRLASLSHGSLMRGATAQCWLDMQLKLADDIGLVAQSLHGRTKLSLGQARSLMIKSYGLSVGLYQSLNYPPVLLNLLSPQEVAQLQPDFWLQLESGLRQLWRGALSSDY